MKDTPILSAFQELDAKSARDLAIQGAETQQSRSMVFDACHLGVVLRAVLFVEAVTAVGAMYGASSFMDWLTRLSLLAGGALPATLVWLICACSLKKQLAQLSQNVRSPRRMQSVVDDMEHLYRELLGADDRQLSPAVQ